MGNQTTSLVQLLSLLTLSLTFLPTVCALPHFRYSNEVAMTFKGLHQLTIVGNMHLRPISKGNGKPKKTREKPKVQIGQRHPHPVTRVVVSPCSPMAVGHGDSAPQGALKVALSGTLDRASVLVGRSVAVDSRQ